MEKNKKMVVYSDNAIEDDCGDYHQQNYQSQQIISLQTMNSTRSCSQGRVRILLAYGIPTISWVKTKHSRKEKRKNYMIIPSNLTKSPVLFQVPVLTDWLSWSGAFNQCKIFVS
ncbi:Uncharacterized protein TCM_000996 [Theobroma cacao]|uniref:Uncharacterized protein n=1 Tax=Theobroma cacao TaxID=3641 RepID=A0A061DPR8_THECC|nr:Uncharacterized protein TCM_000996 [Theobroma cacao]